METRYPFLLEIACRNVQKETSKKVKKRCWQIETVVVRYSSLLLRQKQQQNGSKRLKKLLQKKLKSCWQTSKDVISYKSCCWNREQHENWTLITKQYIPTPKILTWIFGTKPKQKVNNGRISQDVYSTGSKKKEWIFLKTSFQEASIFLRKISIREFDPGSGWTLAACLTHASRTKWSSSERNLVADGWVTRG